MVTRIVRRNFLYLRREPMAPTTAAAGASAGTNLAATGRTRSATGRMRLMAGMNLFLMKFFWWGASELKSIFLVCGVLGVKGGYAIAEYNNMGDMRPPLKPPTQQTHFKGVRGDACPP